MTSNGGIFYPQVTNRISGNTAGTTALVSSGTYVLAGGANITLSQDANSVTIVGGAGGGGDAIRGIAAGGSTATTNTVLFSDANGVSFGFGAAGNSTVLTASHNGLTSQSNQAVSGSNGSFTFQTVSFSNANGVSFGTSAGPAIVASVETSYAPSNHSHGNPTLALTNLTGTTASASNGFTLSLSGNAAAPAQTNQTIGLYASSNTTLTSSGTVDARSMTWRGIGGISIGISNSEVLVSGPQTVAQTNQTLGLFASSNTTLTSSGTADARSLSFRGIGGVSVGVSNGEVLISGGAGAAQTNQTVGWYASSNTTLTSSGTQDARSLSVRAIGNISAGFSLGELLLSVTTAAQSNQTVGLYASSNTTLTSSGTADARSLSFRGIGGVSVGVSANEVLLSGVTTNGLLASQSTQFLAITLGGNTAGTTSFHATNNASIFLHGGNNITLSGNGSSITISAGVGGGGAVVSNAIQQVSSATGSGTNTSRFAADDHVHAGVYGVGVSNDAGNTVGDTRVSFGRHVFRGGANITLSQITAANELNTIVISAAAPGGAGAAKSYFANLNAASMNSSAIQIAQSTSLMQPFILPYDLSASYVRFPITMSIPGSLTAVATAANVTRGMTISSTINVVIYSLGTGVNASSLQAYASGSASFVQQMTIQANANGSQWSSGYTVSYPRNGGNTNTSASAAATSASFTMNTTQLSDFTGLRFLDVPFTTSLAAGAYWMLYGSSTSLSTSGTANMSTMRILASNFAVSQPNQAFNIMGSATNSSNAAQMGLGSYTTNAIATTASVALQNVSSLASNPQLFFQMIRQA